LRKKKKAIFPVRPPRSQKAKRPARRPCVARRAFLDVNRVLGNLYTIEAEILGETDPDGAIACGEAALHRARQSFANYSGQSSGHS